MGRRSPSKAPITPEMAKAMQWGEGFVLAAQRLEMTSLPPVEMVIDEFGIPQAIGEGPHLALCPLFQDEAPSCERFAGAGTLHPGTGPCSSHKGNSLAEAVGGA